MRMAVQSLRAQQSNLLLLAASCLTACSPDPRVETVPQEPVVVYASYEDRAYLPALFEQYTKESGVTVIVRHGAPGAIVDDVIANKISPAADVLLTPSVRGVFRAAEEGALRPIPREIIGEAVPSALRDPDGLWAAVSHRSSVIVYDADLVPPADVGDFGSLAEPKFRGQLCLTSSSIPLNRTVIAMLIDELGVRDTEVAVRGWVANLANPPFDTEAGLLNALESGSCVIAIVSSRSANDLTKKWATLIPQPLAVDIEGVGIARHAHNPDGAARLVEWLLAAADKDFLGEKNVGLVAWHDEDARKLAERARFN